jgi:hypothetical protein
MKPKKVLTPEKMKELSIEKWEFLVKNPDKFRSVTSVIPELEEFTGDCPYCEMYYGFFACKGCPVQIDEQNCLCDNHPFSQYIYKPTSENAQKVLDIIKNIKV